MRDLMVLAAVLLAGCQGQANDTAPAAAATQSVHPESGLPVIVVTITHAGKAIPIRTELTRTPEEQAKGLMFRTALGPDEGMLFTFDPPKAASFWMKNTVIPLDLVFIGTDGRITNIAANAKPYDESPLKSVGLAKAVLELPGGRAAEQGIVAGDTVTW